MSERFVDSNTASPYPPMHLGSTHTPARECKSMSGIRHEAPYLEFISFADNPDGTKHHENTREYAMVSTPLTGRTSACTSRAAGGADGR